MWVCLPESGSKTLASCSLEAIYLLYLECPSNAQDLVPLGSKKTKIEFMKFADSGCYLCLIHWRCLSWVAQGSVQLGQLSSVKVWVNWVHLVVCFQGPHQEETTGLHPEVRSVVIAGKDQGVTYLHCRMFCLDVANAGLKLVHYQGTTRTMASSTTMSPRKGDQTTVSWL